IQSREGPVHPGNRKRTPTHGSRAADILLHDPPTNTTGIPKNFPYRAASASTASCSSSSRVRKGFRRIYSLVLHAFFPCARHFSVEQDDCGQGVPHGNHPLDVPRLAEIAPVFIGNRVFIVH